MALDQVEARARRVAQYQPVPFAAGAVAAVHRIAVARSAKTPSIDSTGSATSDAGSGICPAGGAPAAARKVGKARTGAAP
jgi:hypothetical protein